MRARWLVLSTLLACVPADEAPLMGSVEFPWRATEKTTVGIRAEDTADGWSLAFDRVVLALKTMTIGKIGVDDACAFRGRGAQSDIVFDPRRGAVQTFNGLQQTECPDVGVIFGAPGDQTTLGRGMTIADLTDLASGTPAHAIIQATATRAAPGSSTVERLKIDLRFDPINTGTRFGGCRSTLRGVRILAGRRETAPLLFAGENLFREAISTTTSLRVQPFDDADTDDDGVVTMAELDAYPLARIGNGVYQMPNGSRQGASLGDFVRVLFRFTVLFRTVDGLCVGNEPGEGVGEDEDG